MFHSILYILLLGHIALALTSTTNLGPVEIDPGFRVRFYQVSVSDVATNAELDDFLTNQRYVSDGTMLGQLNGITELTVKYNRYHNDFIHGFYIDPDEVKQFVVEFRGYFRMSQGGRFSIRWQTPQVKPCGVNVKGLSASYIRFHPGTYLDTGASDTLCINDYSEKTGYDDMFTGNNIGSNTATLSLSKYLPDMWYPIILSALIGGDALDGEFWYGEDLKFSQMEPENSGYNPGDDYEYFDANRGVDPISKRCPKFDKDNYVEPQVPPPFVTTAYTCPVSSSSTAVLSSSKPSSDEFVTSSESSLEPSSSTSVIDPEPSFSESMTGSTFSESIVISTSFESSIIPSSADPSIEPTPSSSSTLLISDSSLSTASFQSSTGPTSSVVVTDGTSSIISSISSDTTQSVIDITSVIPQSSTESSFTDNYSSTTSAATTDDVQIPSSYPQSSNDYTSGDLESSSDNTLDHTFDWSSTTAVISESSPSATLLPSFTEGEPQPTCSASDDCAQTHPSSSALSKETQNTSTNTIVSTTVVTADYQTNPDSFSRNNPGTGIFETTNDKTSTTTVVVVTTVTDGHNTDVEITTNKYTGSNNEQDVPEIIFTCLTCSPTVTDDGHDQNVKEDSLFRHRTTTLEMSHYSDNKENLAHSHSFDVLDKSDTRTSTLPLTYYTVVTSASNTMSASVEDFLGEGSTISIYTSLVMLCFTIFLL
mgnify:CR=1 FL=1